MSAAPPPATCTACHAAMSRADTYYDAQGNVICKRCFAGVEIAASRQRVLAGELEQIGVPAWALQAGGAYNAPAIQPSGPPACWRCRYPLAPGHGVQSASGWLHPGCAAQPPTPCARCAGTLGPDAVQTAWGWFHPTCFRPAPVPAPAATAVDDLDTVWIVLTYLSLLIPPVFLVGAVVRVVLRYTWATEYPIRVMKLRKHGAIASLIFLSTWGLLWLVAAHGC
jgi:hypothetical protein